MAEGKHSPNYYAIIPASVRYDKKLKANEKLLYGEITALAAKEGRAWAKNSYFAEVYGVHKQTVSSWISNLEKRGYIRIEIIYHQNSKQVKRRNIYINDNPGAAREKMDTPTEGKIDTPINEKADTPINQKTQEVLINNTRSNNNTSSNSTGEKKSNTSAKNTEEEPSAKAKETKKKSKYKYNKEQLTLAEGLLTKRRENYPNYREPNIELWANDIRLMMEQDKRKPFQIENAIEWSQNNKFWRTVILSANNLRDKYDQMNAQAIEQNLDFDKSRKREWDFDVKEIAEAEDKKWENWDF